MSISLNDIMNRVVNLEKRIVVTESSVGNPGYVKFNNGLIINFGDTNGKNTSDFCAQPLAKPFSYSYLSLTASPTRKARNWMGEECRAYMNDLKTVYVGAYGANGSMFVSWVAIGYLISNRIRSLVGGDL